MSSAPACKEHDVSMFRVLHHMHNHSAFNGYHYTYSAYSSVVCTGCGWVWRTKAAYVDGLSLLKEGEDPMQPRLKGCA